MEAAILLFLGVTSTVGHVINPVPRPGYISPQATGYIYRSDNNGPASLIQLGSHYQQPHAFAPPIPIAHQPLVHDNRNLYRAAPQPLPYVAETPIETVEEHDDSDGSEKNDEYLDTGLFGLGHKQKHKEFDDSEDESSDDGEEKKSHFSKGESASHSKESSEGSDDEEEGEESASLDESSKGGKHALKAKAFSAADSGQKKHNSKNEEESGYHKVFHKDEYKKDEDTYDEGDKRGNFFKHLFNRGHKKSKGGAKKEDKESDSDDEEDSFSDVGSKSREDYDENSEGRSTEEGHESHYNDEEEFNEKDAAGEKKNYGYVEAEDYDDDD